MQSQPNGATRERVDFSKIKTSIPIPNLIEVQKNSYERFLQMDLLPDERDDTGLQSVFKSVFPDLGFPRLERARVRRLLHRQLGVQVRQPERPASPSHGLPNPSCGATIQTDPFHPGDVLCHKCGTFNKNIVTFCNSCGDPVGLQLKYDVPECEERGMTYAAPLKVTIRLTVYDKDAGDRHQEHPRHQRTGSLLRRNSADDRERHVHHQRHRARHRQPVAPFARRVLRTRCRRRATSSARSFPTAARWVEFEYDNKNLLYVRIDRKRKFYGTVFLRALGLKTDEEILRAFYNVNNIRIKDKKLFWKVIDGLIGLKLSHAINNQERRDRSSPQGKKITNSVFKEMPEGKDRAKWKLRRTISKAPMSPPTWSTCRPAKC